MESLVSSLLPGPAVSSGRVEFPLGAAGRCALIHGFLSGEACEALVAATEKRGYAGAGSDYPPSYRDNDRLVADDAELAGQLFERLLERRSQGEGLDALLDEDGWRLAGVNERVRFCRYRPGTQFRAHQDGVHHRQRAQSRLTFMIYLNDGDFTGGDTVFFAGRSAAMAGVDVTFRLRPRQGSLIVFDHSLWHAGAVVESGCKYVMRSDLMYEPDQVAEGEGPFQPGHRGYVWVMAAIQGGGFASAGRDASIRLWDHHGRPRGRLEGHTQSILGLVEIAQGELVSHSRDRSIRRWNLVTGESTVVGSSGSAVLSSAQLVGGSLATGDAAGGVTLWNLETTEAQQRQAHESWVWAIAPLCNGGFATASEDGTVKLWLPELAAAVRIVDLGRPLRSLACGIDAQGNEVLAAGDVDGRVHLIALESATAPVRAMDAHDGPVRRVRFQSRDVLLTCGEDGLAKRWDMASGASVVVGTHQNFATDVLAVGDGRWLSCGYDGRILMHGGPALLPA